MNKILEDNQLKKHHGWLSRIMDKNDRDTYNKVLKSQLEIDDNNHAISKLERVNNHNTREKLNQFKNELNPDEKDFAKQCRLRYLKEQIDITAKRLTEIYGYQEELKRNKVSISDRLVYLEVCNFKETDRKYNKLMNEYVYLTQDRASEITPELIEQARTQPIEDFIEVDKRWFAKCINHDDNHASMYCKGGFAHCFSCGWSGDVISLVMKLNDMNFREAVKYLTKR